MANPNLHVDSDLDLSNASRGVWLVKVCTAIDVANSLWKIYLFIEKCNQWVSKAHEERNMRFFRRMFLQEKIFVSKLLCLLNVPHKQE